VMTTKTTAVKSWMRYVTLKIVVVVTEDYCLQIFDALWSDVC
jgi:hypothetical protein